MTGVQTCALPIYRRGDAGGLGAWPPSNLLLQNAGDQGGGNPTDRFIRVRVTGRGADGGLMPMSWSPYPPMLSGFVAASRWDEAVRLCRFVKSDSLWGCLAGMALAKSHLDTAEIALAAVGDPNGPAAPTESGCGCGVGTQEMDTPPSGAAWPSEPPAKPPDGLSPEVPPKTCF